MFNYITCYLGQLYFLMIVIWGTYFYSYSSLIPMKKTRCNSCNCNVTTVFINFQAERWTWTVWVDTLCHSASVLLESPDSIHMISSGIPRTKYRTLVQNRSSRSVQLSPEAVSLCVPRNFLDTAREIKV